MRKVSGLSLSTYVGAWHRVLPNSGGRQGQAVSLHKARLPDAVAHSSLDHEVQEPEQKCGDEDGGCEGGELRLEDGGFKFLHGACSVRAGACLHGSGVPQ